MHDAVNCTKPDCFGCKAASVQFNPYSMPNRLRPQHAPKREHNSYNRGVIRVASGAPYIRPDGKPIGLHELTGNRSAVEREIRDRAEAGRAGRPVNQPRDRLALSTKE